MAITFAARGLVITMAKNYRTHAKKCFIRAQGTNSEESRQALLEMASYWMDAAMRTECLDDGRLEPEQQAARFRG
jgi:hypothetical protein